LSGLSELLRKAGCDLMDMSLGVLDFAFRLGSNLVILCGLSLVIVISYLVVEAI
jgi:hypothetical protein